MERLPQRVSLIQETATTLKEWISDGILSNVLPGELQLSSRLRVGRNTIRLALKQLAEEGWITSPAKGQQRRVISRSLALEERKLDKLPVTFLSPFPVVSRTTLMEMEDTQIRLARLGHDLRYISPAIFELAHPERHLEKLVQKNPSAAWVLFVASAPMQRWFEEQKIPTLIYATIPYRGVDLPHVVYTWEEGAFHTGIQLVRQGHRVIGVLAYHKPGPGLLQVDQGLKRAIATGNEARLVPMLDDRTPESIVSALEAAFRLRERPTALVFTTTSQLLTCYSWLVSKGIRVPADLSLVSIANDSWFDELNPPICHYRPNTKLASRSIADRVIELVATGRVMKKSLFIPIEYVPGATIGPVPPPKQPTASPF